MLAAAQADGFVERPRAVGVERDPGFGETFGERRHRFHLLLAREHAALQLEIVEAVARMGGFGEAHDRLRCHRLLVAQAKPVDLRIRFRAVRQIGLGRSPM